MNRVDKEERTQRIRIGLTGLAFVFLLVLLGTAIINSGEETPGPVQDNSIAAPEDPLAEIGAAPGTSSTNDMLGDNSAATGR